MCRHGFWVAIRCRLFCFFLIHCSSCRSVSKSEGGSQTVESISYQRLLRRAVGLVTQGMKCIAPTWSCCCDKHGIYFFCLLAGQETLVCCKWRHSWKKNILKMCEPAIKWILNLPQASRCLVRRRTFSFLFLLPCFFQGFPTAASVAALAGPTGPLPGL